MKKLSILFALLCLTIVLSGCNFKKHSDSAKTVTPNDYELSSENLKELIHTGLKKRLDRNIDLQEINLDYPYYENNSIFSTFYLSNTKNIEIGLVYAEWIKDRYELQFIDIYPVDDSNPFSVVSVSGTMLGNKRDYKATIGYIFDQSISEIRLYYSDDNTNSVSLINNKTFIDVVTGKQKATNKIEARDPKDKVIFQYVY